MLGAVVLDPVVVVVVLVVELAQPEVPQASQQLVNPTTQALPLRGPLHEDAPDSIWQLVAPAGSVRQQVTAPGLPQVDRDAHRRTRLMHLRGSKPSRLRCFATPATQRTYGP